MWRTDGLSYFALLMMRDRMDWSEGFAGFGFATQFKEEVDKAITRKENKDAPHARTDDNRRTNQISDGTFTDNHQG